MQLVLTCLPAWHVVLQPSQSWKVHAHDLWTQVHCGMAVVLKVCPSTWFYIAKSTHLFMFPVGWEPHWGLSD